MHTEDDKFLLVFDLFRICCCKSDTFIWNDLKHDKPKHQTSQIKSLGTHTHMTPHPHPHITDAQRITSRLYICNSCNLCSCTCLQYSFCILLSLSFMYACMAFLLTLFLTCFGVLVFAFIFTLLCLTKAVHLHFDPFVTLSVCLLVKLSNCGHVYYSTA